MNSKQEKISAFQFFSLLYLSRTLTTVTYVPAYTAELAATDTVFQMLFRFVLGIITMIPVYLVYRNKRDENIIALARRRSPVFAKVLTVIYTLMFFYFTVETVARLDVFAGTIVFPETNVRYVLIFVSLICCYGAYLGIEALGRSAVMSFILVVPALIFVAAMLIKRVDLLNFSPLLYEGITPVLKTALNALGGTVEYSMMAIALPRVTGKVKQGFFIWIAARVFTGAALFFLVFSVMGNFTDTQFFPMHTLASLSEFAMFDRLDAIITGVWILCAFLKIAFLLYLQVIIIRDELRDCSSQSIIVPIGAVLAVLSLYISKSIDRFILIDNSILKLILIVLTAFVIPFTVFFMTGKKENKKCEKQQLSSQ